MTAFYDHLAARLNASGEYVWPLALRAIMFWEFWESGMTKLNGNNWFGNIQDSFPWPFSAMGAELNWLAATWGELVFAAMLLVGLFTRFAAISLVVITVVATAAVHWPSEWSGLAELWQGYAISNKGFGNFKLPLLFLIILLPLVFRGGGKISLDFLLLKLSGREDTVNDAVGGSAAAGLAFAVLGVTTVFLVPMWGYVSLGLAAILLLYPLFSSR